MKQLIIGAGEVGQALHEVIPGADLRDIEGHHKYPRADVLHIAFPWSEDFTQEVNRYQGRYGADLVIVHSTVPVGTCDPMGWVHSPVRGRHPKLAEGLIQFVKHFGGSRAQEARGLWWEIGPATAFKTAATTEAGKLWEMVQFGLQVVIEKEIHAWCEQQGLDWYDVYQTFAITYNSGYVTLGHPEFVRPILDHMPGPIGGHCVLKACELIDHGLGRFVQAASEAAELADNPSSADALAATLYQERKAARR